jgi:hypothetical protein
MNTEALILFLIILLGLVLCSFLGGNCYTEGFENEKYKNTETTGLNHVSIDDVIFNINDPNLKANPNHMNRNFDNYNHFNKSSTPLVEGTIFYGPNGGTVVVKTAADGTQTLEINPSTNSTAEIFKMQQVDASSSTSTTIESMTSYIDGIHGDALVFYGPKNATATVIYTNDGQQAIRVRSNKGTVTYTLSGTTIRNPDIYNPPGTVGAYNPPGYNPPGTVGAYNPPGYNPPGFDKTYFDSLPPGIPRSQIPPGEEDLYILKSQVVPPVCPACPSCASNVLAAAKKSNDPALQNAINTFQDNYDVGKCPPCPACERCPEPAFECKKVPSYSGTNSYLPMPVISDFSTFGM